MMNRIFIVGACTVISALTVTATFTDAAIAAMARAGNVRIDTSTEDLRPALTTQVGRDLTAEEKPHLAGNDHHRLPHRHHLADPRQGRYTTSFVPSAAAKNKNDNEPNLDPDVLVHHRDFHDADHDADRHRRSRRDPSGMDVLRLRHHYRQADRHHSLPRGRPRGHNSTVTLSFHDNIMSCTGATFTAKVPASKCLRNVDGTSVAYHCQTEPVNVAVIHLHTPQRASSSSEQGGSDRAATKPICDRRSEVFDGHRALVCGQCVKNANSTSSLDRYTRVQCLRTSTQTGARVLGCPDERCDPKHCTPLAGGLAGQCFPVGPQDAFLKSVETGGLILQAQWPTSNCEGDPETLLMMPTGQCLGRATVSCDNQL